MKINTWLLVGIVVVLAVVLSFIPNSIFILPEIAGILTFFLILIWLIRKIFKKKGDKKVK